MTTITELIAALEALRAEHGDLPVFTRDCCGNYDSPRPGVDWVAALDEERDDDTLAAVI